MPLHCIDAVIFWFIVWQNAIFLGLLPCHFLQPSEIKYLISKLLQVTLGPERETMEAAVIILRDPETGTQKKTLQTIQTEIL